MTITIQTMMFSVFIAVDDEMTTDKRSLDYFRDRNESMEWVKVFEFVCMAKNYTYIILYILGHKRPQNRDVYKYVVPDYAYKWRYLGAQLGFKQPILNSIFEDFRNDSNRCCKELLDQWLEKNANASWDKLLLAIDNLPTFPKFFYPGT